MLAQIYIFTIYPGPKFTQPTFTQNPNLHNTKFTPDPNLHDPRFTPPQIYKTQIYTKPDIHSLNFTQNPNLHSPKFTQSRIYNTKICIKFRPNISFQGKDNPILAELDLDIFHKCPYIRACPYKYGQLGQTAIGGSPMGVVQLAAVVFLY